MSIALTIIGIVSLQGYILLFVTLGYYLRIQGPEYRGPTTPSRADRSISNVVSTLRRTSAGTASDPSEECWCPNCGARNDPGFRFCSNCVGPLSD